MVYDSQGRRVQKSVTKSDVAGLVNVRRDYFTNDSLSGAIASTVFGGNVDDSWFRGQGLPYPGSFSYRATAELRVPATGQWTMEVATFEGGARLYVNNVLVVDTWNAGATTPVTLALAAGTAHTLRYEYRFIPGVIGGTTPTSRLSWSGPGQSLQSVPNAADTTGPAVTTTTRYLYDGWNLLAEISSAGSAVRTYAWGLDLSGSAQGAGGVGGLISVTDSVGGTAHFAAYDGNGNVAGLVRADDGSLSARYDYNAFGETILAEGAFASGNPFRFSTKFTDDETGLLYYGFRYYNPSTGRWLSRDPIEEDGGVNLYGFTKNASIGEIDVLGQMSFDPKVLIDILTKLPSALASIFKGVKESSTSCTSERCGRALIDSSISMAPAGQSPQFFHVEKGIIIYLPLQNLKTIKNITTMAALGSSVLLTSATPLEFIVKVEYKCCLCASNGGFEWKPQKTLVKAVENGVGLNYPFLAQDLVQEARLREIVKTLHRELSMLVNQANQSCMAQKK
jgi:RHS repeat-associated protein